MNINDILSQPFDLSEVKLGFDPVAKGTYTARVCKVDDVKESKEGGSYYLPMRFEITEGEYDKRQIFFNFNIPTENSKPTALSFFKSVLVGLGYTEEELKSLVLNKEDLLGRKCYIVVDIESTTDRDSGETKLQNKIKSVKKMGDGDVLSSLNG